MRKVNWWGDNAEENQSIRGKSIPMCPCPPKIPYGLA